MTSFKDKLSFAILVKDVAWRADLTARYCEYFAHKLNSNDFSKFVFFPDSIDDALNRCETEYLMILSSGFIPFNNSFFDELLTLAVQKNQMFIGEIVLDYDFAYLDQQFLFVDISLWIECGQPKFASSIRSGVLMDTSDYSANKKIPHSIKKVPTEENIYVAPECSSQGAELIIAQLNKFESLKTLSSLSKTNYHFLNNRNPYLEIHTESKFEKLYVEKNKIHSIGNLDFSRFERKPLDILVTPADGIRSLVLAEELKAPKVVIFSKSNAALEFQKLLFGQKQPRLFGEIVRDFLQVFPSLILPDDFFAVENHLIVPFTGEVEFVSVDCTSFEVEELIKGIDHTKTVLFDFSNIFVLPHNYYRRPLYQIEALFAEVYSLIKSRTGPSFIAGLGPKFIDLYGIDVNTSSEQYKLDIDAALEMEELPEVFFKPDLSALKVKDEEITSNWFTTVTKAIEQTISPKEPPALPKHENVCVASALDAGFSILSEENNVILVAKEDKMEECEVLYFYGINVRTAEWKFFVGKKSSEKRIEFSNGISEDSCIKHINLPVKINIKTAIKYFQ